MSVFVHSVLNNTSASSIDWQVGLVFNFNCPGHCVLHFYLGFGTKKKKPLVGRLWLGLVFPNKDDWACEADSVKEMDGQCGHVHTPGTATERQAGGYRRMQQHKEPRRHPDSARRRLCSHSCLLQLASVTATNGRCASMRRRRRLRQAFCCCW